MKIKKSLIPKREKYQKNQKEKILTTNYESIKPENIFIKNILQKNSSLKDLKETIQKESNNNMHEIFSSEENRLKAIKYVLHVSKGKENQKNCMNQYPNNVNNKKNVSFISCDAPLPEKNKNRIEVKKSPKVFNNRLEQLSPIKNEKNDNDDRPLFEEDSLKYNNNKIREKKINRYDYSPSTLIPSNQINIINSQRETNIIQKKNQISLKKNKSYNNNYIDDKTQDYYDNKNNLNDQNPTLKNNNYIKLKYSKTQNERFRNPQPDYSLKNKQKTDNVRNKTIDIYNQSINSELNNYYKTENNFNNYNSQQKKKDIYSINNNNDIKFNVIGKYNHKKNISQDYYSNDFQIKNNNTNNIPFYSTEVNHFYEPNNNNRINYINNSKKLNYLDNNNKSKTLIRIMNKNNNGFKDLCNNNYYPKKTEPNIPFKKKNNSLYINDSNAMKINPKEYKEKECNNNLSNENKEDTNFSFHKKIFTNISYKTINANNEDNVRDKDNKEKLNILNNKILVKKRPLKENQNIEIINPNEKNNNTKYNVLNICQINAFNYESTNENKIIFESENEIFDYIRNKYEEDKNNNNIDKKFNYTGFCLTKKYKGKILYEIKIEDNINIINKKLKDENVKVNNELIEIITVNNIEELYKLKDQIITLEKDISKIKEENENLTKKDSLKNELIQNIDKEKQNLIEENKKICIELNKIKQLNNNLNEQLKELLEKNKIAKQYEIEKMEEMNIAINPKIEMLEDKKIQNEKIEINKTPKYNNDIFNNYNILSIELIDSNLDGDPESKRSNLLSGFRASRVSDIKDFKINNNDSGEKDIKKSLDLLYEKSNDDSNIDKDGPNTLKENGEN